MIHLTKMKCVTWSSRQEKSPSKPKGPRDSCLPIVVFGHERKHGAVDTEKATLVEEKLSHRRDWAGQPRTEATGVGACRAARPSSLIDALLITLIKANF